MAESANAILEAWYPGERGGQAIAETLTGAANPAGRLPITFYRATVDLPPFENYMMPGRTYRYFDGPVMYRFGYGLSYTNFWHTPLQLSSRRLTAGDTRRVRTTVTNAGKVSGDEVLPLFLLPPAKPGAPLRQLVAFMRVNLRPGECRAITLEIEPRALSLVAPDGTRSIVEGEYGIVLDDGDKTTPPHRRSRSTFAVW